MNDSLSVNSLAQRMRDVFRSRQRASVLDADEPTVFAEVAAAAQAELEQRLNAALVLARGA